MADLTKKEKARLRTARWRARYPERAKASQKASNAKNPKGAAARSMRWTKNNPTKARKSNRRYKIKLHFGISLEAYDALLEVQNNHCALCPKTAKENGRRLAVDHDHSTGRIRGLLCVVCNHGLGALGDTEAGLLKALEYIRG